ncbi:uncharacterized protein [Solanum lycopersicum]|uniref:uncharacterized protein n=1 Tax=Solanum lycopersicum TaxID=4081 RepID=UPI00374902BA
MNIRRTAARRVGEEIVNVGVHPQGNQNAPQVWWGEGSLLQMDQDITPQAQDITAQANREVVPRENQQAGTMARRLRDFTRMNPSIYFGSKVDEDPQDFLDVIYKILLSMGVSTTEKVEFAEYKLKDVAQTWGKRESKVEEFINLRQRGISVKEYSLKFIYLSKYASSLVSNARDEMSHFVTGVSEELKEECRASILHGNIGLSMLMVHAQLVEESRLNQRNREAKREKWTNSCYGCGKGVRMVKNCPNVRIRGKRNGQAQPRYHSFEALKRNRFCALKTRGEKESSPDVVTVPVVREFPEVFPIDLPGVPPEWVDPKKTDAVRNMPRPLTLTNELNLHHGKANVELLKNYDMSVLYHPGKANVVADALSRMTMGSVSHVEEEKKERVKDDYRLGRLGVRLEDSPNG